MILQPYKFKPLLKSVLWGGERIKAFKGIDTQLLQVGESWEISGIHDMESVVDGGTDDGLTLTQLTDKYGPALVGQRVYERHGNRFPLLVKLIDAHRDLSVQVHPDDQMAQRLYGCNGKTEMWYVIDREPGAQIMSGFSHDITAEEYDRLVAEGTIMSVVAHHTSHRGQVFFLPAGRIHAIGAGNFVAEIQQSSDVTYRVFDYNRVDSNGQQRELHTALARQALDFAQLPATAANLCPENAESSNLVTCDYFVVDRHKVKGTLTINVPDSFMIIMCIEGSVELEGENMPKVRLSRGQTVLCPACLPQCTLEGCATLLTAHC